MDRIQTPMPTQPPHVGVAKVCHAHAFHHAVSDRKLFLRLLQPFVKRGWYARCRAPPSLLPMLQPDAP
jgi:hypothetical protein